MQKFVDVQNSLDQCPFDSVHALYTLMSVMEEIDSTVIIIR